ncbi:unannotated protein [freshwater metagenome]|uniref:Unannotated protein n=1 Tax=freshwater metagenome TaxID=449393 RepID=A0A6J6DYN3_9ZZZZ
MTSSRRQCTTHRSRGPDANGPLRVAAARSESDDEVEFVAQPKRPIT